MLEALFSALTSEPEADPSALVVPYALAASVILLASLVMYAAEKTVRTNLTRLEERRIRIILKSLESAGQVKDVDGIEAYLKGDVGQTETVRTASWLGEIGAVFTGFVSLVGADILLLRDREGQELVTLGCLFTFLLGAAVLTLAALHDPQTPIKRVKSFISWYQLALLALTAASAVLVFVG